MWARPLDELRDSVGRGYIARSNEAYRHKIKGEFENYVEINFGDQITYGVAVNETQKSQQYLILANGTRFKIVNGEISPLSVSGEEEGEIMNPITTRELLAGNREQSIKFPQLRGNGRKDRISLDGGDGYIKADDITIFRVPFPQKEQFHDYYKPQFDKCLTLLTEFTNAKPISVWS